MAQDNLDIDKIIAEYKDFYRKGTITPQQINKIWLAKTDTKKLFTVRVTDNTRIDEVNVALKSVMQAFYGKFSPKGKVSYTPNPWNLDHVKINERIQPHLVAATALDFLDKKGNDVMGAPLLATIADYYLQKAEEDDELEIVFKGEQLTPTSVQQDAGIASETFNARNGIRKYIRGYAATGVMIDEEGVANNILLGAVPTDPILFVKYMEDFYKSIPIKYRRAIKWFAMSSELEYRFREGMRMQYNTYYIQVGNTGVVDNATILNTGVKILGFDSHIGSDMIWTSFPENCIGFVKNPQNKGTFNFHKEDLYNVQMGADWYEGYNFVDPRYIWTNGEDL